MTLWKWIRILTFASLSVFLFKPSFSLADTAPSPNPDFQTRLEEWKKLKVQNPEEFERRVRERKSQIRERIKDIKQNDPQKFEQFKERFKDKRRQHFQNLRQQNPERFEKMMQNRMDRFQQMQQKNPERFQQFMQNHPRFAERMQERKDLRERREQLKPQQQGGSPRAPQPKHENFQERREFHQEIKSRQENFQTQQGSREPLRQRMESPRKEFQPKPEGFQQGPRRVQPNQGAQPFMHQPSPPRQQGTPQRLKQGAPPENRRSGERRRSIGR